MKMIAFGLLGWFAIATLVAVFAGRLFARLDEWEAQWEEREDDAV